MFNIEIIEQKQIEIACNITEIASKITYYVTIYLFIFSSV